MPTPFQQNRISIDTSTWTAITVPFSCMRVVIKNDDEVNAVKLRTDSADALTEDILPAGGQEAFYMSAGIFSGTTLVYAQAVAGTGPLIVKAYA